MEKAGGQTPPGWRQLPLLDPLVDGKDREEHDRAADDHQHTRDRLARIIDSRIHVRDGGTFLRMREDGGTETEDGSAEGAHFIADHIRKCRIEYHTPTGKTCVAGKLPAPVGGTLRASNAATVRVRRN